MRNRNENVRRARDGREMMETLERVFLNGDDTSNLVDALTNIIHATNGEMNVEDCARVAKMHYLEEKAEATRA